MKLFSRKAIVAGATALAVTFAGTSVAVAQEETPSVSAPVEDTPEKETETVTETVSADKDEDEEEGASSDPKDITAWISVFTAVIGALGTLFTFANKHFDFMG